VGAGVHRRERERECVSIGAGELGVARMSQAMRLEVF
jgi:hypothetical protein